MQSKKNRIKATHLHTYLVNLRDFEVKEIHFKSGISYSQVSKALNNQSNLLAKDFLLISKVFEVEDINKMAEFVFSDYVKKIEEESLNNINTEFNEFGQFISNHLYTKKSLANKADIDEAKLNNLLYISSKKGHNSKLFAVDLFVLTKILKRNFELVLKSIFPDLGLLTPEKESELVNIYDQRLLSKKRLRDSGQ